MKKILLFGLLFLFVGGGIVWGQVQKQQEYRRSRAGCAGDLVNMQNMIGISESEMKKRVTKLNLLLEESEKKRKKKL